MQLIVMWYSFVPEKNKKVMWVMHIFDFFEVFYNGILIDGHKK